MAVLTQEQSMTAGALLVAPGAPLPPDWRREDDAGARGWSWVSNTFDPLQRERDLLAAGWTFFFMAGAITATSAGWSSPRMLTAGLTQLIEQTQLQGCNCLEIQDVGMRSFLGIPYVSMSAHPRHIQQGKVFRGQ